MRWERARPPDAFQQIQKRTEETVHNRATPVRVLVSQPRRRRFRPSKPHSATTDLGSGVLWSIGYTDRRTQVRPARLCR